MNMFYKKHPKGTYEYTLYKRKVDIIITVVLFALALGLYITGKVATGSNRNLLTIVAVLGLLPACKMVVDVIMCFKAKPCDMDIKASIDNVVGKLTGLYNMYFTSYDKNFSIDHLVITDGSIIGYSSDKKFVEKDYITHMNDLLRKDGLKDIHIKVFDDKNKYLSRLEELNKLENVSNTNMNVLNLILNVTL